MFWAVRSLIKTGQLRKGGETVYEAPTITDLGSIADHTFSRCNPQVSGPPIKDREEVPHHIDVHLECSALS